MVTLQHKAVTQTSYGSADGLQVTDVGVRGMAHDAESTGEANVRRAAIVAGIGILVLAVLAVVANFGAINGPVTEGDATRTATDIAASAGLFRLGIAALVVVVLLDVLVAWALRIFFLPVDHQLATLAAWFRLAYATVFAVAISQLVGVLPLVDGEGSEATRPAAQRADEVLSKVATFHDIWSIALVLFGIHLLLVGVLAYRSGFVPRPLGGLLVVAGLGYLTDTFLKLMIEGWSFELSVYTFVGEALFMLWLLVKGRRVAAR